MNGGIPSLVVLGTLLAHPVSAQYPPGEQGSTNLHVVSHVPLGGEFRVTDIEIEQELSRPFAYVSRFNALGGLTLDIDRFETTHGPDSPHSLGGAGFDVIDLKEPTRSGVIFSWRIDNPELHQGLGAMDTKYFKIRGRYYLVQSFQFAQGGPDVDLGAVVFDVTGLPDPAQVEEVDRIRAADTPGGFHNIFAYKHSDGRALLFTTTFGPQANVYDLERAAAGEAGRSLAGRVPIPSNATANLPEFLVRALPGYHDIYVGYDPATRQDRFYGGGAGGYYVYDVSRVDEPKLLTSVTGMAGVGFGHTFTPTPAGRYAVAETEYQYAPLRIVDMKAGLDGQVRNITRPVGAWAADWKNVAHNHEVRWPYVFVSGYEDGLHVFNMMDPTNPYTVGFYDTYDGPHKKGLGAGGSLGDVFNGAFGVDVRNADGLIVVSDMTTGFWALRMDGFDGWNGHQWGMPNVSSAQDWDNGPDGAPTPARVS